MNIMGKPSATYDTVVRGLDRLSSTVHPRFRGEMLDPLWKAAEHYGVDPVGMIAQAYKETAGGQFTGAVTPAFFNTAGIKVRSPGKFIEMDEGDRPLAHQQFPSWKVGAIAHAQHLRAYAGVPVHDLIVDPRYDWVIGRHSLTTFEELGGKWAPAANYGTTLVALAQRLVAGF